MQVPGLIKVRAHSFFQRKFTEHLLRTYYTVPATEDAAVDNADRVKKEGKRTGVLGGVLEKQDLRQGFGAGGFLGGRSS